MLRRQREIDPRLAEQAFQCLYQNMYIQIGALEEEIARLNRRNSTLDKELFLEERAVQAAQRWVANAEADLPRLEAELLEKERELDETTRALVQVQEEVEILHGQVDAAVELGQLPQDAPELLRRTLELLEGDEETGAQALTSLLLQGGQGSSSSSCQGSQEARPEEEEAQSQAEVEEEVVVEEEQEAVTQAADEEECRATPEVQEAATRDTADEEDEEEKQTCGCFCFKALWKWARR